MQLFTQRSARHIRPLGFTLIELLVVIVILSIVTAATIPLMSPPSADRKVREAAREFATTLEQARGQAISTGRPAGVMIELGQNSASLSSSEASRIFLCEVPLPYSGDTINATATIDASNTSTVTFSNPSANVGLLTTLCKYGDKIRFNSRGPYFTITGGSAGTNLSSSSFTISAPQGYALPAAGLTNAQFQIFRQPVKSTTPPTVLASNAPQPIIDLSQSGMGQEGRFEYGNVSATSPSPRLAPNSSVMLTFQPSGQVERLTYTTGTGAGNQMTVAPNSTLFFLVRLRREEGVMTTFPSIDKAYLDPEAYWVSVNPFTGAITVADVDTTDKSLVGSRQDAIKNQTTGSL